MASPADRIESKLARLLQERDCDLCRTRVETCPECHRPVGSLPGTGDGARHRVIAEIDRLAERRAKLQAQLDGVV